MNVESILLYIKNQTYESWCNLNVNNAKCFYLTTTVHFDGQWVQSVNVWLQPQANKLFDCLIALGGTGTSVYYFFTNQLFCCFVHFFTIQLFCFVVLFMCFYLPIVLLFCLLIYQQARSFEFPFNVFCSQQFFFF